MSTSGSKLSQEEIKDIMRIYNVEVFKPEVMSVLSGYSEAEIHQIGSVLQKKQTDGKIQNPTALLIKNPAQICVAIMADQFYPTQQRKWSSEVEIYISPQELEELKRNCQPL